MICMPDRAGQMERCIWIGVHQIGNGSLWTTKKSGGVIRSALICRLYEWEQGVWTIHTRYAVAFGCQLFDTVHCNEVHCIRVMLIDNDLAVITVGCRVGIEDDTCPPA